MSVKNTSRIMSTILKPGNNQETSHTIVYLKNYGNLSGGIKTRRIITPRSVRSTGGDVGTIKSTNGIVGSVRSIRRGLPANGENFFKKDLSFTGNVEDKTLSLTNNQSNINSNSFLFSNNLTNNQNTNINNNNNTIQNNNIFRTTNNNSNNNNNDNINNNKVSNFADIFK